MAKAQTKDVATVKETSTAIAEFDYGKDAGAGYEGQTADDMLVPFLTVLQGLSPQVQEEDTNFKVGQLFNTVSQEAFDGKKGVEVIPLASQHVFVEWTPRDQGGGFVKVHDLDSPTVAEARENSPKFGKFNTAYNDDNEPIGNDLVETYYLYALTVDGDDPGSLVVIAFTSTKIKVFKRWNTRVKMFSLQTEGGKVTPPLFAHKVRITTAKDKNNKGEFFNFVLDPATDGDLTRSLIAPGTPLIEFAKQMREQVIGGTVKAAYETQQAGSTSEAGDDADAVF